MNILSSMLLLATTLFLYSCNEAVEVKELEFTKRVDGANSADAFRNTVHPILLKRCASCHGDGGSNLKHSVSDYKVAHDVIVDGGKVDFGNPANSRLVDKLVSQRHNCWDGDCDKSGKEMLEAINEWIALRGKQDTLVGAKTKSLKYKDAIKRAPETINGVIVLQAEDGDLTGRFKKKSSSSASGYSYIGGNFPARHPIEQTGRTISIPDNITINGTNTYVACKANEPGLYDASARNGLVRISEPVRHPSQEGYRYYSQLVRFRMVHPNHRNDLLNALKTGGIINGNWFLRMGYLEDDGTYDGNAVVSGNGDSVRVLPEFKDNDYFKNVLLNVTNESSNELKKFFSPRFGDAGIDYFTASSDEIRQNLQTYLKQRYARRFVQNSFASFFFDNLAKTSPLSNSKANNLPKSLIKKPKTGADKYDTFVLNDMDVSTEFYNHYLGDFTEENSLDVLGCTNNGTYNSSTETCSAGYPIRRIDIYVNYSMDPAERSVSQDFSWSYKNESGVSVTKNFDLGRGNTNLDLTAILSDGNTVDRRSITETNYADTLRPLLINNCASCHADGGGNRPSFANGNKAVAFDAINGRVNFATPANSRIAQRMDEGHNCGNNAACASIKTAMIEAINTWKTKDEADIAEAEANQTGPELVSLSQHERTPGRARYKFHVTEDGDYNVWLKVITSNDKNRFNFQIKNAKTGAVVKSCMQNQTCSTHRDAQWCRPLTLPNHSTWTWVTPGINNDTGRIDNKNNKVKWTLEEGDYYLDIYESEVDTKLDMIAISNNDEFNPRRHLVDEGVVSSADPRILRYDVSKILNSPGFFEIEIQEKNGGDSYAFKNPRFVGNKANIKVQNIKILINDKFEFTDSAYTKIQQVVGTNKTNLTYAPLIALSINGLGNDSFSFVFQDLKIVNLKETVPDDDIPVAVNGRECKELALFKASVKPILNRFRLIRKDDDGYKEYTESTNMYPGRDRGNGSNAQFYTCTTCHNEQHPYFKMTTFLDNDDVLCKQALSRVDFSNFDKSLMIRGLNGTFNHPKLHFVESVPLVGSIPGSGANRSLRFRTNSNKVNGYDSSWAGARFQKYSEFANPNGDIDNDGIKNSLDVDMDGDLMLADGDTVNNVDSDNDGIINQVDPDDDNDGILDEDDDDDDNDGVNDIVDNDNDNDGIADASDPDWDNDGWLDAVDTDDDGDGVLDIDETKININAKVVNAEGQIVDKFNDSEKAYLRKFIGQYVRVDHVRIRDFYSRRDGDIRLPGDSYDPESLELDKWTYARNGLNMIQVKRPENYVKRQNDFSPNSPTSGGLIKVKESCVGVAMNNNDGTLTDPCNDNEVVIEEFEDIKTRYRNAIINWMKAEAKAHGQY